MTTLNGWQMADDTLTWMGNTEPDPQGMKHTLTAMVRMEPEPPVVPDGGEKADPRGTTPGDSFGEGFYLRLLLDGEPQTVLRFQKSVWEEDIPGFARRNPADICMGRVIQVVQESRRLRRLREGGTT